MKHYNIAIKKLASKCYKLSHEWLSCSELEDFSKTFQYCLIADRTKAYTKMQRCLLRFSKKYFSS